MVVLTLLEPESRFGDKLFKFQVVCPQNGTGALKGLTMTSIVVAITYQYLVVLMTYQQRYWLKTSVNESPTVWGSSSIKKNNVALPAS